MLITSIWVRLTWFKVVFDYNNKSYSWLVVLITQIPLHQSADIYLSPIVYCTSTFNLKKIKDNIDGRLKAEVLEER